MAILVAGGAGYIGSHTVCELIQNGYETIVYDNLSEGHIEAVKTPHFVHGDINDADKLTDTFLKYNIDTVMHFSAYTYVGESVTNPQKYYLNNVSATLTLLSAMLANGVNKLIFSSSCATYGTPTYIPIDENHPQNPVNPYGATKLMVERILSDYSNAYDLRFVALRYFNAAGAIEDASIGESHRNETHLIPLILKTLTGERENVKIFGNDYDTPDGTCVRDYIHVTDLATAHRLAVEKISADKSCIKLNLGTGKGYSVKEVIAAAEAVTGKAVSVLQADRRAGDPPYLVAAGELARKELGFKLKYTGIRDIIKTAWDWEKNRRF